MPANDAFKNPDHSAPGRPRTVAARRPLPSPRNGRTVAPIWRAKAAASGASRTMVASEACGSSGACARRIMARVAPRLPSTVSTLRPNTPGRPGSLSPRIVRCAGDNTPARDCNRAAARLGARRATRFVRSPSCAASSLPSSCAVPPRQRPLASILAPPRSAIESRSSRVSVASRANFARMRPASIGVAATPPSFTALASSDTERSRFAAPLAAPVMSGSFSISSAADVKSAKSRARSAPRARV